MHEVNISPVQANMIDLELKLIDAQVGAAPLVATAIMSAKVPTVTAVRHATVNAVPATETMAILPPVAGGSTSPFVTPTKISSVWQARIPTVAVDATVNAVTATSVTGGVPPINPLNISAATVRADSTSLTLSPSASGETVLTGGGVAGSTWSAIAPAVSVVAASSPTFGSLGAEMTIAGSTASYGVPAGVTGAATQCVVAVMWIHEANTITPPTGFFEAASSPVIATLDAHRLHVFWKRPTAADTGVYNFDFGAGITGIAGAAMLFNGCVATGTPITGTGFTDATNTTNTTDGASVSTGASRLALWIVTNQIGNGVTFSGGFTERYDEGHIAAATLPAPLAGTVPTSGSLVATTGSSTQSTVWLGTILPT